MTLRGKSGLKKYEEHDLLAMKILWIERKTARSNSD